MKKLISLALISICGFILASCGNSFEDSLSKSEKESESKVESSTTMSDKNEEGYWLSTEIITITEEDLNNFDNILEKETQDVNSKLEKAKKMIENPTIGSIINLIHYDKNNRFEEISWNTTMKTKDVSGSYSVNNGKIDRNFEKEKYIIYEDGKEKEVDKNIDYSGMDSYQSYENRIYIVTNNEGMKQSDGNRLAVIYSRISETDGKSLVQSIKNYQLKEEMKQSVPETQNSSTNEPELSTENLPTQNGIDMFNEHANGMYEESSYAIESIGPKDGTRWDVLDIVVHDDIKNMTTSEKQAFVDLWASKVQGIGQSLLFDGDVDKKPFIEIHYKNGTMLAASGLDKDRFKLYDK